MSKRKAFTPEQIIIKLREAEVLFAHTPSGHFKAQLEKAGIKKIRCHDLRHTTSGKCGTERNRTKSKSTRNCAQKERPAGFSRS